MVRHGDATVVVKRHHLSVRTPAQLAAEHAFASHLRMRGQPVPAVLRLAGYQSVLRRGDFCYEAQQVADGVDLYRDAVSGRPTPASATPTRPAWRWLAGTWPRRTSARLPARPAC